MRYLITGGAGFVGSHLADALVERGDDIVILDDLTTGRQENIVHLVAGPSSNGTGNGRRPQSGNGRRSHVELVEGTTLEEGLVDELMRTVDGCFHLASAVGVQLVVDRPLESLLRNVRGVDNVTAAAARHDARLMFTSTSEIYGKNSGDGLHEQSDRLLGPATTARWGYATAKTFGEMLAYGYHREHAAEMTVVRLFNTVGPRQTGYYGMVLPRLVRQALDGADLTVYGDGSQSRCFAHVYDVVEAILMLMDNDDALGNVWNIGCPTEITILELAERILEHTGSSSEITFVPYEEAYGEGFEELGRRKPDITALSRLTGWSPTRTVDDAIDDVIAYEQVMRPPAKHPTGQALDVGPDRTPEEAVELT